MATTNFDANNTNVRYYGYVYDSAGVKYIAGQQTEIWLRVFGKGLKLHCYSVNTAPLIITVDGSPVSVTFVAGTNVSPDILSTAGVVSDGWHEIVLKVNSAYASNGFRLIISDAFQVTADGTPSLSVPTNSVGVVWEDVTTTSFTSCSDHTFTATWPIASGYKDPQGTPLALTSRYPNPFTGQQIWRRATCTELWIWGLGQGVVDVYVDGRLEQSIRNGNGVGTFAFIKITGLDGNVEHEYLIVGITVLFGIAVKGSFSTVTPPVRIKKICWFGDSVTAETYNLWASQGTGMDIPTGVTLGVKTINRGVSGNTTAHLNTRVSADVVAFSPDLTVYMAGYNDSLLINASDIGDPLNITYVETTKDTFNQILAASPGVKILVIKCLNTGGPRDFTFARQQEAAAACNDPSRVRCVDSPWPSSGIINSSGLHPWPIGYDQVLGDNIGVIQLTAQPSAGDSVTVVPISGDSITIRFGTEVSLGATFRETNRELFNYLKNVPNSGVFQCIDVLNASLLPHQQAVSLRATSLSKTGNNITVYQPQLDGVINQVRREIMTVARSGWVDPIHVNVEHVNFRHVPISTVMSDRMAEGR